MTEGIMQRAGLIFFLFYGATMTLGADVVIGILGNSVSIVCKLPISHTLVWDNAEGDVIAMHGKAVNSTDTKHVIERQNGVRESLVIHNLSLTDDTVYRCYDLRATDVNHLTKLNVIVRPEHMRVSAPTQPVLEGTEVTLVCEANGGKPLPVIEWYMKGADGVVRELTGTLQNHLYRNGTGRRTSVLQTNVTRSMFRSEFVCNISVAAFYRETLTLALDVHLMPLQPRILDYTGSYDVNTLLKLECNSGGSVPMATANWMLDGLPVRGAESIVIPEQNGTFTVRAFFQGFMTRGQNGSVLTCAVSNSALQERGLLPVMTNLTLFASSRPRITLDRTSYTVTEGDNVTLQCHINARPFPGPGSVVWLRDGRPVSIGVQSLSGDSRLSTLTIQHAQRSDRGNYSCRASNRLGSGSSPQIRLAVLYRPACASTQVQKFAARYGHKVRLVCQMHAYPHDVTMVWKYASKIEPIKTMVAVPDPNNTELMFSAIDLFISSPSQYTSIACYGNNTEGISQQPCRYRIVRPGPAETPTNCAADALNTTISVHCDPGFSGGSQQTFLLQHLKQNGFQTTGNDTVPAFTFENYQNVTIRMCAVNAQFNDIASCALPLTVRVKGTRTLEAPVTVTSAQTTAYIAGSVTAFVGLVVISAILVYILVTRRRKECLTRRSASTPITLPSHIDENPKKSVMWRNPICSRSPDRQTTREELEHVSNVLPRCAVTTDGQNRDQSWKSSSINTSTPCREMCPEAAFRKHNSHTGDYRTQKKLTFSNILDETTGFAISPIVTHRRVRPGGDTTISYIDEMGVSLSVNTSASDPGVSGCYSAADIDEILDQNGGKHGVAAGCTHGAVIKHSNDDIDDLLHTVNNEHIDDEDNGGTDRIKNAYVAGTNTECVDDICNAEINDIKSDSTTDIVIGTVNDTNSRHVNDDIIGYVTKLNDYAKVYKQDGSNNRRKNGDLCHGNRDVCTSEHVALSRNEDAYCLQNYATREKEMLVMRSVTNGENNTPNMETNVSKAVPMSQEEVSKLDESLTTTERTPSPSVMLKAPIKHTNEVGHTLHTSIRKSNSFPYRCRKSRDKSVYGNTSTYGNKTYGRVSEKNQPKRQECKLQHTVALIHSHSGMDLSTYRSFRREIRNEKRSDVPVDCAKVDYTVNTGTCGTQVDASADTTQSEDKFRLEFESDTIIEFDSFVGEQLQHKTNDKEKNVVEHIDISTDNNVVSKLKQPVPYREEMSAAKTGLTRRYSFMAAMTYEPLDSYQSMTDSGTECGHLNHAFEQNERSKSISTEDDSERSAEKEREVKCGHFNHAFEKNEKSESISTEDDSERSAGKKRDVDVIAFF